MLTIIVDADACPRSCMATLKRLKGSWGYRLLTVSSVDHQIDSEDHITVGKGKDNTDLAVINNTSPGDIVVTQDWGLAALALGKGAQAIAPSGRIFTDASIDFLLEERFLKAQYRRAGGRTKGPTPRSRDDDQRFEASLIELLKKVKSNAKQ
ncbi:MAG TPA: DUF188 domain-containing protein [Firmicutes bacterium]|jgi:uncharacterized protein YaiI (UPF0178 family)|nr:MAG: hypothetical protein AA931_01465 [Peptococcaceae bacterium 1109]HHT72823.1 DUF188 domain-containing protein [Bacillota bacterium]